MLSSRYNTRLLCSTGIEYHHDCFLGEALDDIPSAATEARRGVIFRSKTPACGFNIAGQALDTSIAGEIQSPAGDPSTGRDSIAQHDEIGIHYHYQPRYMKSA